MSKELHYDKNLIMKLHLAYRRLIALIQLLINQSKYLQKIMRDIVLIILVYMYGGMMRSILV